MGEKKKANTILRKSGKNSVLKERGGKGKNTGTGKGKGKGKARK